MSDTLQRRRHRLRLGGDRPYRRHQRHHAGQRHRRLVVAPARRRGAEPAARLADPRAYAISTRCSPIRGIHVVDITGYPDQHAAQFIARREGRQAHHHREAARDRVDRHPGDEGGAAESGVKVCVCFECRYSSQFLATKSVIDAGLLGTLHYGEIDYYHGIGPWYGQYRWNTKRELGGSALLTAGCHALDALLLCMGGDVEEVTSYATQSANPIFKRLRISDHVDDDPAVQERRGGQVRRRGRLPAALLLPHPPGRQRRQPARQQASTRRSSAA